MNKTLYEEAVADAQKLKELAEETAKNSVIDAVMPQIRYLVNKRILGEGPEGLDDEMMPQDDYVDLPDLDVELDVQEEDDPSPTTHLEIEAEGDVNINLGNSEEVDSPEDDLVLNDQMSEALRKLIKGKHSFAGHKVLERKMINLEERVKKLSGVINSINTDDLNAFQRKRLNLSFLHCVREAFKLRSEVIITEGATGKTQEKLERRLAKTIKEMKNMSKSNRRNIFDFLFEAEDEKKTLEGLEEAELSLELTDEEQEDLATAEDVESVESTLDTILGDLEVTMAAAEPLEGEEDLGGEEGDEDLGLEDPLGEEEPLPEMDEIYEIDESMLRRELKRMMTEDAVDSDPYLAHDGEEVGDVILDVNEDDLINALADEIGDTDIPSTPPMVAAESRRRRARNSRSRRRSQQRSSMSARKLSETKKENARYRRAVHGLKSQLVEMNLFNAKLLYANKLMQNKNLTMKQQKAIVEALDNAKTLREAKLLFKSLTGSLNRKSSKKLTEGSLRTLGSSSRSTRSASATKSGVEVDRWAVLAGIPGKTNH